MPWFSESYAVNSICLLHVNNYFLLNYMFWIRYQGKATAGGKSVDILSSRGILILKKF